MTTSIADFIDTLRNSRLLEPGRLDELLGTPEAKEVDAPTLAQCLVQLGWLTTYQVEQLFQGKGQTLLLAGYRVQDQLPSSPDGSALRARHPDKEGRFVLKVLPRDRLSSPLKAQRLREEVKLASQLAHPNIARAIGVETIGDEHIYIREYVEGVSLAQLVEENGPVSAERAGDYLHQAAQGLQEAHARGLAHGRLRPPALLVVHTQTLVGTANHDGSAGQSAAVPPAGATLKIADFGLAVLADDSSPRQDLRDLGAIAVLLLFGREPSDTAAASITPQWQDILRNLLTEEPGAGYQSAAELMAALNPPAESAAAPALAESVPMLTEAPPPADATLDEVIPQAAPVEEPATALPDTYTAAQADTIDEPIPTGHMPPLAETTGLTATPPPPYVEEAAPYSAPAVAEPPAPRPAAPPRKRKYDAKFWLLFSLGLLLHLIFCGGIVLLIMNQLAEDSPPTNKTKFKTVRPATKAK
jgi:serine/threonine protein kinase